MKKFFKKYFVVIIGIVICLAFIGLSILNEAIKESKTELDPFKEDFPKLEYSVVVLARSTCTHCHNLKPRITKVTTDYDIPLYWFTVDLMSKKDINYLMELFSDHDYEGYVPYIAISNNGEIVASHTGELKESEVIDFFKENNIIK